MRPGENKACRQGNDTVNVVARQSVCNREESANLRLHLAFRHALYLRFGRPAKPIRQTIASISTGVPNRAAGFHTLTTESNRQETIMEGLDATRKNSQA